MKKETRAVCHDDELNLEAYRFEGIAQPFPNHFHDYYVLGSMEAGRRCLSCKNREYVIKERDVLIFHPGENHGCRQEGDGTLDYRGINIPVDTMLTLSEEITGRRELLGFSETVITNQEVRNCFTSLHEKIMSGSEKFEKEEQLFLLMEMLIEQYGQPFERGIPQCRDEIQAACLFMEKHYEEHISLEQLCSCSTLSKSTLLRAFTKSKGITPYRYLQSFRISKAKELLENGATPMEAALRTGFADQSHFTHFFHRYIGLSPAAYRRIFQPSKGEQGHGR